MKGDKNMENGVICFFFVIWVDRGHDAGPQSEPNGYMKN